MHGYRIDDPAIEIVGALSILPVGGGIRPRRLPDRFRHELPSRAMEAMVDCAAGVRLRFATTATSLSVTLAAHPFIAELGHDAVDLVVDGVVTESVAISGTPVAYDPLADTLDLPAAEPVTARFAPLAPGEKVVELWLPHTAIVDVFEVTADARLTHAPVTAAVRWVHHGSSISHCFEALSPTRVWPAVAARALGYELTDLSFAGQAMLDPFVARTIRDLPADVISLKLGINLVNADIMRMRAFGPAVHGFLDTIREGQPLTPIVLVSPILCPVAEDAPGPTLLDAETGQLYSGALDPDSVDSLTLSRIRTVLSSIVAERAVTDPNLHYLDGRSLFSGHDIADGHLPDGLHPDDEGYRRMGERFAGLLPGLLSRDTPEAPAR